MRESKFYLFLGLGVLAFSLIWITLVFFQIEGDLGGSANTPRTIPFFLGICMSILGIVFLYHYKVGYVSKNKANPLQINEIRNLHFTHTSVYSSIYRRADRKTLFNRPDYEDKAWECIPYKSINLSITFAHDPETYNGTPDTKVA